MIYFTEAQLKAFSEKLWKAGYNQAVTDATIGQGFEGDTIAGLIDEAEPLQCALLANFEHDYKEIRHATI